MISRVRIIFKCIVLNKKPQGIKKKKMKVQLFKGKSTDRDHP